MQNKSTESIRNRVHDWNNRSRPVGKRLVHDAAISSHLTIPSYAKINLGLQIVGKRSDGYHDLETIFQQISLRDTIAIELASPNKELGIRLSSNIPGLPVDSSNLAVRAAELFCEKAGCALSIKIDLQKTIPIGAGLGGGSSNAATVLLGLNRLLGCPLAEAELHSCAVRLGADVPFFLRGGVAVATGIGDVLKSLAYTPNYHIVIVAPGIAISTKWAYTNLKIRLTNTKNNLKLSHFLLQQSDLSDWPESLLNDFEPLVFGKYKEIQAIRDKLYLVGANYASLSGSGSAVYGIFDREEKAREGVDCFRPHYSTFLTKPMQFGLNEVLTYREG